MITNSKRIGNVIKSSQSTNEYFFTYKGSYKWSIMESPMANGEILLYYYPMNLNLHEISMLLEPEIEFITYKSGEFKSKEADESFRELFSIVKSKYLGMDKVLDDILNESDDLPF